MLKTPTDVPRDLAYLFDYQLSILNTICVLDEQDEAENNEVCHPFSAPFFFMFWLSSCHSKLSPLSGFTTPILTVLPTSSVCTWAQSTKFLMAPALPKLHRKGLLPVKNQPVSSSRCRKHSPVCQLKALCPHFRGPLVCCLSLILPPYSSGLKTSKPMRCMTPAFFMITAVPSLTTSCQNSSNEILLIKWIA